MRSGTFAPFPIGTVPFVDGRWSRDGNEVQITIQAKGAPSGPIMLPFPQADPQASPISIVAIDAVVDMSLAYTAAPEIAPSYSAEEQAERDAAKLAAVKEQALAEIYLVESKKAARATSASWEDAVEAAVTLEAVALIKASAKASNLPSIEERLNALEGWAEPQGYVEPIVSALDWLTGGGK